MVMSYSSRVEDSIGILVLRTLPSGFLAVFITGLVFATPFLCFAETSLSLTVTPPLVQLSLDPGSTWQSTLRVVNGNPYPLTIYPDPVVFRPSGEEGKPEFVPSVGGEKPDYTLAGWMDVPEEGVTIRPEQTYELPVRITVPEDAAPGGHYAALLIGNKAPDEAPGEGSVSVTSAIASLFFLNISGDVLERGRIRDFSSDNYFYQAPEARFSLRFENLGNVHLQPRGDITIYNMWGKRRGYIPVNQSTADWGNVLPDSMRRFSFVWSGDIGLYDIGRYRAEATLGYGTDAVRYAGATTYFWIVPVVQVAKVLGTAAFLIFIFAWAIRAYVRRALALEAARIRVVDTSSADVAGENELADTARAARRQPPQLSVQTLMRPLQEGIVDLRARDNVNNKNESRANREATSPKVPQNQKPTHSVFLRYVLPLVAFALLIGVAVIAVSAYFEDVLTYERTYSVEVED